jgi:hypothetical protein
VRHQVSNLRHEHAVPRKLILERLMVGEPLAQAELMALLDRLCLGVVLTREEDAALNAHFRSSMPPHWDIGDPAADAFARYRHPSVGLFPRLHPPRGLKSLPREESPPKKAAPGLVLGSPRQRATTLANSKVDCFNPEATLQVIADLQGRFRLRNEHFRLLHHGIQPSLGGHVTYCRKKAGEGGRFTVRTNVDVCKRLRLCLEQLDQGASWNQAISRALAALPLPGR